MYNNLILIVPIIYIKIRIKKSHEENLRNILQLNLMEFPFLCTVFVCIYNKSMLHIRKEESVVKKEK